MEHFRKLNQAIDSLKVALGNFNNAKINLDIAKMNFRQAISDLSEMDAAQLSDKTNITSDSLKWICKEMGIMPADLLYFHEKHKRFPEYHELETIERIDSSGVINALCSDE